jgi:hypothetical protein
LNRLGDEMVGQRRRLFGGPGMEGGDELGLLDQAGLKGEQSEEEMSVSDSGHGRAPGGGTFPGKSDHGAETGSRRGRRIREIIA